jgi:hypothetical protein
MILVQTNNTGSTLNVPCIFSLKQNHNGILTEFPATVSLFPTAYEVLNMKMDAF